MESIVEVLMRRDGSSRDEVEQQIEECRDEMLEALETGEDPEEIYLDYFGLEPDWMVEVLFWGN